MSEADDDDYNDGRLVIDEDSPRSPSPEPVDDDEEERGYYLVYYQWSLGQYKNLLLPREP